ncbi:MAG: ATP-binding cassette domain-containing protein [Spirochaetes bacterium]|nr:ATP-binding cassette domain-containing protein [Spirochaetota bacterium]MBU0953911.1 ATP-binding cassette domain-containing protein [Spirochaetota bacterium]
MIQVEQLSKTYTVLKKKKGSLRRDREYIKALDHLSFTIGRGEICGYIGPNGAGKSTTIKILSGILHPDRNAGSCLVNGRVPWKNRLAHVREIGVVFGQRTQLWWDLPASDSFELLADMYQVPSGQRKERINRLKDELELHSFLHMPVRQMSLGQRMRCELSAALIHNPPLLFLDEPTIGLDAPSKIALRNFIRWLNREYGTTIILTTHDMDDIEALAGRVLLIGKGRLLFDGSMQALRREAGAEKRIVLDLASEPDPHSMRELFRGTELRLLEQNKQRLTLAFNPERLAATEALKMAIGNLQVADLAVEGQPVEELIAALYSRHNI